MKQRIFQWACRGSWAVLDQFFFACAGFLVNILLARWLLPQQYGAFALAFAVFLFLGMLQSAFFIEPMLIFGAAKYDETFRGYFFKIVRGYAWLALLYFFVLSAAAFVFWKCGRPILAEAFSGMAIAAPFMLALWMFRRVFYVRSKIQWSVMGGLIYLCLMPIGTYELYLSGKLSTFSALVGMALFSCVVNILLFCILWSILPRKGKEIDGRDMIKDHWNYGKWIIGMYVAGWTRKNIFYIAFPFFFALEGAAVLKALLNFTLPIYSLLSVFMMLSLPYLSRTFYHKGSRALRIRLMFFLIFYLVLTVVYGGIVFAGRHFFADILYHQRYMEYMHFMGVIVLLPVLNAISNILLSALKIEQKTRSIFIADVISSIFLFTAGFLLCLRSGLGGALTGMLATQVVYILALSLFYLSKTQKETGRASS